jgi:hypothetical protein
MRDFELQVHFLYVTVLSTLSAASQVSCAVFGFSRSASFCVSCQINGRNLLIVLFASCVFL